MEQFRATLAILLVMIILFLSITISEKEERDSQNHVAEDEIVYSEIQHSALRADNDLDFGLTLTAEDVTNTGLTLTFEQSGGTFKGELQFDSQYSLEKLDGAKWVVCDTLIPEEEIAWTMELHLIQEGGSAEWDVDWTNLYGELKPGNYRIAKNIFDNVEGTPDFDMNTYFAYFTVK